MADDFFTTQWSVVLRAGKQDDSAAERALSSLCERYWFPLYAYVRRRAGREEAQDLTQAFFARVLEKKVFAQACPERGRFRAFLLTSLKHFLANEAQRAAAEKRGGKARPFSFDWEQGESRLSREPAHDLTAERLFERAWAQRLLELVLQKLRAEYAAARKAAQFELLQNFLSVERQSAGYAAAALELGMTEDGVRQAAHRLRKRYREILREEVSQTVAEKSDVDEELRSLFETLSE